jgi:uncharacterized protein (TIGR00268 family)
MDRPEYVANPSNRCYYYKQELFGRLTALARERGIAAVADGNNADDRGDYRPGREAAREFGVRSPLDEADLSKAEVRELSRRMSLPTWDEPASACLSSRIPYNSTVTVEKLRSFRGYFIVVAFVVAAVVTPPDVISQLALAVPMCLLYEVGILGSRWFARVSRAPDDPEETEKASS